MYEYPTVLMPLSTQLSVPSATGFGIFGLFHSEVFLKSEPLDSRMKWASCQETRVFCMIGFLLLYCLFLLPKKGTSFSGVVCNYCFCINIHLLALSSECYQIHMGLNCDAR